jgi:glutathione S-transferase
MCSRVHIQDDIVFGSSLDISSKLVLMISRLIVSCNTRDGSTEPVPRFLRRLTMTSHRVLASHPSNTPLAKQINTMTSSSPAITFYDIASAPPLRTFAANPWKARFALNFKRVQYQTQWTQMPDIHALREELGVPANRTLPDGSLYHTLPVVKDDSTGKLVGDSFEIALYLDHAYPDHPTLLRPMTTGLTAGWNQHVDGLFTKFTIFCGDMPFDPEVAPKVGEMFAKRAENIKYVNLDPTSEDKEAKMKEFANSLGELAKAYKHTGGTTDYFWLDAGTNKAQAQHAPNGREQASVWLDGDQPAYADFIVGAWLKMFEASMPKQQWEMVRSWQDGLWGRIVDALDEWATIK